MKGRRKAETDPEAVAIAALSYLATDQDELARFLALTGLGPESLREAVAHPAFAESLLDFVLSEDRLVLAVAAAQDLSPDEIVHARGRLEARRMRSSD